MAYAAQVLGIPARIFVPEVSSPAKISRIRGYGADLVVEGATYSDALAVSQDWIAASGALPVHAYDQAETILGAGTTGLELLQQAPAATPCWPRGRRRPAVRHRDRGDDRRQRRRDARRRRRAGGRADDDGGAGRGRPGRRRRPAASLWTRWRRAGSASSPSP